MESIIRNIIKEVFQGFRSFPSHKASNIKALEQLEIALDGCLAGSYLQYTAIEDQQGISSIHIISDLLNAITSWDGDSNLYDTFSQLLQLNCLLETKTFDFSSAQKIDLWKTLLTCSWRYLKAMLVQHSKYEEQIYFQQDKDDKDDDQEATNINEMLCLLPLLTLHLLLCLLLLGRYIFTLLPLAEEEEGLMASSSSNSINSSSNKSTSLPGLQLNSSHSKLISETLALLAMCQGCYGSGRDGHREGNNHDADHSLTIHEASYRLQQLGRNSVNSSNRAVSLIPDYYRPVYLQSAALNHLYHFSVFPDWISSNSNCNNGSYMHLHLISLLEQALCRSTSSLTTNTTIIITEAEAGESGGVKGENMQELIFSSFIYLSLSQHWDDLHNLSPNAATKNAAAAAANAKYTTSYNTCLLSALIRVCHNSRQQQQGSYTDHYLSNSAIVTILPIFQYHFGLHPLPSTSSSSTSRSSFTPTVAVLHTFTETYHYLPLRMVATLYLLTMYHLTMSQVSLLFTNMMTMILPTIGPAYYSHKKIGQPKQQASLLEVLIQKLSIWDHTLSSPLYLLTTTVTADNKASFDSNWLKDSSVRDSLCYYFTHRLLVNVSLHHQHQPSSSSLHPLGSHLGSSQSGGSNVFQLSCLGHQLLASLLHDQLGKEFAYNKAYLPLLVLAQVILPYLPYTLLRVYLRPCKDMLSHLFQIYHLRLQRLGIYTLRILLQRLAEIETAAEPAAISTTKEDEHSQHLASTAAAVDDAKEGSPWLHDFLPCLFTELLRMILFYQRQPRSSAESTSSSSESAYLPDISGASSEERQGFLQEIQAFLCEEINGCELHRPVYEQWYEEMMKSLSAQLQQEKKQDRAKQRSLVSLQEALQSMQPTR